MWNSNIIIGDDGSILVHHRKLVPTFYEKLVWSSGDGEGLRIADTRLGKIGGLICGENTNPLARFALMAQGEQVHISSWPPMWPTRHPGKGGNFDNVAANRIRASAHSFEAKAFGIVTAGFMDDKMRSELIFREPRIASVVDATPRAASFFVGPTGDQISKLLQDEEGIVYADIDIGLCVEPKQFHDVVGYYNRFDVFDLKIRRDRHRPASFVDQTVVETSSDSQDEFADGIECCSLWLHRTLVHRSLQFFGLLSRFRVVLSSWAKRQSPGPSP
jgi:aliphatic nitrilase